ncbi:MAG: hypothetical protein A3F91_11025 [Flavobacteria bacterium RIFCSPLOWO2_12_FULL_35_11]|nr:MAG: hypothetical protein A3F91_11025 [Flavobacteria bacterium RIFCSPLOWO2_12_FULL_35_11]
MRKISILLIVGFLILSCKDANEQPENLPDKTVQLSLKNDSLEKEIVLLKSLNDSLLKISHVAENLWFDKDFNGAHLTRQGITNPEKFVENSLRKRVDLIPFEAVLGGTMKFGKIQLLGNKWVIADYSDGHIQGRSIYEYRIDDKKVLTFKILASNDTE